MNGSELPGAVEVGVKLRCRDQSLWSTAGLGANGDLGGAGGFGSVEMAPLFCMGKPCPGNLSHEEVYAVRSQFQILLAGRSIREILMLQQPYTVFGVRFGQ